MATSSAPDGRDVVVSENRASNGGGIHNVGSLSLIDSEVASNLASTVGLDTGTAGGVYNAGDLSVVNTRIIENTARGGGGLVNLGVVALVLVHRPPGSSRRSGL